MVSTFIGCIMKVDRSQSLGYVDWWLIYSLLMMSDALGVKGHLQVFWCKIVCILSANCLFFS